MIYGPDYEKMVNDAVQAIMPNTVQEWGLVALMAIGIWFVCAVVIIVLEATKHRFTPPQDRASSPDS